MNRNLKVSKQHADYSGKTMESRDHSKNGASPKSQTSKKNFLKSDKGADRKSFRKRSLVYGIFIFLILLIIFPDNLFGQINAPSLQELARELLARMNKNPNNDLQGKYSGNTQGGMNIFGTETGEPVYRVNQGQSNLDAIEDTRTKTEMMGKDYSSSSTVETRDKIFDENFSAIIEAIENSAIENSAIGNSAIGNSAIGNSAIGNSTIGNSAIPIDENSSVRSFEVPNAPIIQELDARIFSNEEIRKQYFDIETEINHLINLQFPEKQKEDVIYVGVTIYEKSSYILLAADLLPKAEEKLIKNSLENTQLEKEIENLEGSVKDEDIDQQTLLKAKIERNKIESEKIISLKKYYNNVIQEDGKIAVNPKNEIDAMNLGMILKDIIK